jgi:predicted RNA-binding protein YlxR (DUF448 family)
VPATLERRAVPTRSCVHCRTGRDKRELLRVVRAPDGAVQYDPTGKANGRGAYVCHDEACIAGAMGRSGLGRALGTNVPVSLADELRRAISRGTSDGTE